MSEVPLSWVMDPCEKGSTAQGSLFGNGDFRKIQTLLDSRNLGPGGLTADWTGISRIIQK